MKTKPTGVVRKKPEVIITRSMVKKLDPEAWKQESISSQQRIAKRFAR